MHDAHNPFGQVPVGTPNFQPRCPCLLLLDTSGSMRGMPIAELNAGVQQLYASMLANEMAADRIELAIVTFGHGGVEVLQEFQSPSQGQCPTLEVDGYTPMAEAIQRGLDLLNGRVQSLRLDGIKLYKPWVVLITDGGPTDTKQAMDAAIARVREEQQSRRIVFWAFGVQGADMRTLHELAGPQALMLEAAKFRELFDWISLSLNSVSRSQPGEGIKLTPPPAYVITV